MTYENIQDVPAEIAEFYSITTVSTPTGGMVTEEYTYLDENNEEQTGSRLVPEMATITSVVANPRGQQYTWESVDTLIRKHGGGKDSAINQFISFATGADNWEYHDNYLTWLALEPTLESSEFVIPEDGVDPAEWLYDESSYNDALVVWQDQKPVRVDPSIRAEEAYIYNAKIQRDLNRYAPIDSGGNLFDADALAYENMKGTVASWEGLVSSQELLASGLVDGTKMAWTLADNSVVWVTKQDLEAVILAVSVRAGMLQAGYVAAKGVSL